jgi:hypothetical protein
MRVCACQKCGESFNAGLRGPIPTTCGPCHGRRRPGGPPLPKKERPRKTPEERIRSDRFTSVPGRIQSECGHCGKTLWLAAKYHASYPRHFCGQSCKGQWSRRAVPHRYNCVRCGKQCSMQGNPRQKQKGLYCSRKCAGATRGEKKSADHAALLPWKDLGSWFYAWGQQEIDPRVIALEKTLFPSAKRLHRIKLLRQCADCGGPRGHEKRRCSRCRLIRKKKVGRENGKLRTRCKRFGVEFDSKVTRLAVCNRDGWICAICGVKTIKATSVTNPHPREATLDHITPLSRRTKGNTWDNVQCACRRCNCYMKRDRVTVSQRRMF